MEWNMVLFLSFSTYHHLPRPNSMGYGMVRQWHALWGRQRGELLQGVHTAGHRLSPNVEGTGTAQRPQLPQHSGKRQESSPFKDTAPYSLCFATVWTLPLAYLPQREEEKKLYFKQNGNYSVWRQKSKFTQQDTSRFQLKTLFRIIHQQQYLCAKGNQ